MAANAKAKLLNSRRAIKGQLTRLETYLGTVKDLPIEEVSRGHIINLQTRLHNIDRLQSTFNELQNEIDLLSDDTELPGQTIERDSFNENCYELISEYTLLVESHEQPTQNAAIESQNLNQSNHSSDNASNRQIVSDIKLPTIQLPRFDGAYDKWLEFNDIYNALIHNNANLSNIQKFYYLKSALSGEAALIIQSVGITDANYAVAWQLVSDRYKNDDLIINSYVRALFELPEVTRDSASGLRNFCDSISKNIRCLQTLKQPVDSWDVLLVHLITSKLDNNTNREWQQERSKQTNLATYAELKTFLTHKCTALEGMQETKPKAKPPRYSNSNTYAPRAHSATYVSVDKICSYCKDTAHPLYYCIAFKQMPIAKRIAEVKKQRLCYNCLSDNHVTRNCESIRCRKCNGFHHTLLHMDNYTTNNYVPNANIQRQQQSAKQQLAPHTKERENPIPTSDRACNSNTNSHNNEDPKTQLSNQPMVTNHSITSSDTSEILLSTAIIDVKTARGDYLPCRVLLDPGSQSNCITFKTCKNLNLPIERMNVTLHGINAASSNASSRTNITFKSKHSNYTKTISCLVLKQITEQLPLTSFNKQFLKIPNNINLADPNYNKSSDIDILIGAQLYLSLLSVGQISLSDDGLAIQKTKLGWILGGQLRHLASQRRLVTGLNVSKLEALVHKFWECETIPEGKILNREELICEEHFKTTTYRNEEGKFVVKIPFSSDVSNLGSSRTQALDRFHALERKLSSNTNLREAYTEFMREYIDLNHMQKCIDELSSDKPTYYLPHHPVVKPTNVTTKVRVVFDASCSTNRGNSLNSMQLAGAILQSDLYSILLRFRQHKYVMIADIEKMYRQILMQPEDRRLLRIFWRENELLPIDCFELNTLTYGTTSAPFLATRCLFELAEEARQTYPSASEIIKNDFYMDDLVTGARTLEELHTLKTDITDILSKAHFPLRKWLSNDTRITTETKTNINLFNLNDELASKTLGILWDSRADTLQCNPLPDIQITKAINKRSILSQTAQLFDPLGLYSPVIIIPKIILQELWQLQLSWDESIPQDIALRWQTFQTQLPMLEMIAQPRFVLQKDYQTVELHGFADASMKAYGACVYVRSVNTKKDISVNLLTAKSRVAPLKTLSLPRLELCAAVLLSNLMRKVMTALRLQFSCVFYWSDSTVTLCWIKSNSNRWKTFVANRVADIQNNSAPTQWGHVKSEENPADYISRGIWPQDLQNLNMWWSGPKWLKLDSSEWPAQPAQYTQREDNTEQKTIQLILTTIEKFNLLTKYSNFMKLTRIIAYCLRFINNCKQKDSKLNSPLTISELNNAIIRIVKLVQRESFATEIKQLENSTLTVKHKFANLSVFSDDQGVMRVGGRLRNSEFDYDKKHPMLLPHNHHVTQLIAEYEHIRLLHCGPQALLYAIRERFWPINGRNMTRQIVYKCIKCFKANPKTISYQMGNLPLDRLKPTIPFATCGIDYAGPISIRDRKGRGFKVSKAYICLFICFSTKAIHLDLVTDLTTEAFIATFRRFVARRGRPNDVYSDNGTNFVGANAELARLAEFFVADNKDIEEKLTNIGIKWHFIPPRSPTFGGLWEAGVKSAKLHLKRVLGDALLTYENLLTILVQIEAILNSRPLTPLNSNPNDMQPLTPAHFLIGKSLTTLADTDYFHVPINRLGAYQHQQKIVQDFWKRWQTEYISNLQTKPKWKTDSPNSNIEVGDMVILKDNNLPPLRWKLGRVKEKHQGKDGRTRVLTIRLPDDSTMKRAATQLCPLPKQ